MQQEFIDEIITAKKDINNEVFLDYFKYQNPSFLVKDLISAKQNKNETLVNINNRLIDLRNGINRKEIPENENWKKVVNIIEKIPKFSKQQKGQGIKIWTPKQMLQRSPIALAQVKTGNISDLLNEIRQIIYSLYIKKEVAKKYKTI